MHQATQLPPSTKRTKPGRLLLLMMILFLALALPSHEAKAATDCGSVTEIPVAECEALVALYNSTDGPNWVRQDNWLLTDTPCFWYGVGCTSENMPQYVTSIILPENGLSGDIPAEIGTLSSLQQLILSENQLSSLPTDFGNLSSLSYLDLYENQLSSLPAEIGTLSSLSYLDLAFNQLSSLPAEIGNLSRLDWLLLNSNPSLRGPLPASLVQLTALSSFWFHDTNLCEPGNAAFQSWLANIPDLQRTNVICSGTGKVTIVQDSQPNSVQDFRYSGDFGPFRLDNVLPNEDDGVSRQKSFEVESGVYTVRQEVPGNWLLTNITCDPAANAAVHLENQQVTITHSGANDITCTFTNQRKSIVRVLAYKDSNGDAQQNPGERPLNQWPILLYDAQGKARYPDLRPGNYTVCLELKEAVGLPI